MRFTKLVDQAAGHLAVILALALSCGCSDSHQGSGHGSTSHAHHHEPPHGGTGVVLGDEDYHLEFVLDAAAGRMQAYVLSAHMESFVRINAQSFEVTATLPDRTETLTFKPVANAATGETVGDTSQFEAQAEWLKSNQRFDAVLKVLTIRSKNYTNVAFSFPTGN